MSSVMTDFLLFFVMTDFSRLFVATKNPGTRDFPCRDIGLLLRQCHAHGQPACMAWPGERRQCLGARATGAHDARDRRPSRALCARPRGLGARQTAHAGDPGSLLR